MSDLSAATAGVTEADQKLRDETVEPRRLKPIPRPLTSRKEPRRSFSNVVQDTTSYFTTMLAAFTAPSDTVTTTLEVKKRIAAGALGAISFQSAIVLSKISYDPAPDLGNITIKGAVTAASIILF